MAKLRGEVSALRKEKADWQKTRGIAESAALQASQAKPEPAATTPAVEGMQWVEQILNAPALTDIGMTSGLLGRPIWFYLVFLAWGLAAVEWFLYQRRWIS